MKTHKLPATIFALFIAVSAMAQTGTPAPHLPPDVPPPMQPLPEPQPSAIPQPSAVAAQVPLPVPSPGQSPAAAPPFPPALPTPSLPVSPGPVTAAPATAPVDSTPPPAQNAIRMNFQNASLTDVLNYLSEAAGFVIVQETPVSGTVNVVSRQPINANEAVDLLNTVLVEKGYIAIRNGRILKIVSSHDAQKHDLPVEIGSDPEQIPRKDGMVTQILPIRYMDAGKLIDNLRPLLSADATISANDSSNAILLTDTQTNIHRMAEIIHSLDTSISGISTIRVFPLRYADAKDFANVLTQLFSPDQANSRNGQNQPQVPPFLARFMGGQGGNGRGGGNAEPESVARKAASRVIAVADAQSNSVVVSAPDEYMSVISEIVSRLDTSTTDITETRIFRLEHADSVELSGILNSLYGDGTTTGTSPNRTGQNQGQNGQRNNNAPRPQAPAGAPASSERALLQARVVAVPDPRTNAIIVNASRDTMDQIALTIGRLDASDSKKQHVYVHVLDHADPDNVATILRGMFGDQSSSSNSAQPTSSALNQRTTTGASSDVTGTLNTNGTGSSGGRGAGR